MVPTLREAEAKELPGVQGQISMGYARPHSKRLMERSCIEDTEERGVSSRYLASGKSKCG